MKEAKIQARLSSREIVDVGSEADSAFLGWTGLPARRRSLLTLQTGPRNHKRRRRVLERTLVHCTALHCTAPHRNNAA